MEDLIQDISSLSLKSNDIIILYYDDNILLDNLAKLYTELSENFPNNKVIALNKKITLATIDKRELINLLQS